MIREVERYWNAQPCGIKHSDAEVGSLDWAGDTYERRIIVQPHTIKFTSFWPGSRILELGCGTGADTFSFAVDGHEVTAVDISQNSIELARQRMGHYLDMYYPDAIWFVPEFIHGDIEALPELLGKREAYDLIYSFGVLHHTPHPERVLTALRDYRHKDTELRIMVYHRYSWKALRIALGLSQPEAQADCPLARTYSKREIAKLLFECGWQVTAMRVEHIFPYNLAAYKAGRYEKVWLARILPRRVWRWIEQRIGWHLLVEARPL